MTVEHAKTMRAWVLTRPGPIETGPLSYQAKPVPSPAPGTPPLNYERELFYEKELRSFTSNTRHDGRDFLLRAARYQVRPTIHAYPMAQAQQALQDLKAGRFDGAAVLVNDRHAAQ